MKAICLLLLLGSVCRADVLLITDSEGNRIGDISIERHYSITTYKSGVTTLQNADDSVVIAIRGNIKVVPNEIPTKVISK